MTVSGKAMAQPLIDRYVSGGSRSIGEDYRVEGSQDVTVAVVGSEIAGALAIDDISIAGTFRLH